MQRAVHVKRAPLTIRGRRIDSRYQSGLSVKRRDYFCEVAFLSILGQLTNQAGSCKAACCFFGSFPDARCAAGALLTSTLEKFFMPGNAVLPDKLKMDTFPPHLCIKIDGISTATLVPGDLPTLLFPWLLSRQVGEMQAMV